MELLGGNKKNSASPHRYTSQLLGETKLVQLQGASPFDGDLLYKLRTLIWVSS